MYKVPLYYIKGLFRTIHSKFLIFKLWCICLFKRKADFYVSSIFITDAVLIKGNVTTIFWDCKNVYKIKIKGLITFPGNKTYLILPLLKDEIFLEIEFHGFRNKIKKKLHIQIQNVTIQDSQFKYSTSTNFTKPKDEVTLFQSKIGKVEKVIGVKDLPQELVKLTIKTKINQFNSNYFKQLYYGK